MSKRFEILTTLLMIALGVLGYIEAQNIRGMSFDPLGPTAFPIGISLLLIGICGVILISSLLRRRSISEDSKNIPALAFLKVFGMLVLVTLYAIAVFSLRLPLSLMTIFFVLLASTTLPMKNRGRDSVIVLGTGLVTGVGAELIFTRFFFVDLPTLW